MLNKIDNFFNKFGNVLGYSIAVVLVLMILNVFYDAITRYFFNTGSIAMQEMEWHFFSVVILLGMGYTLQQDAHVRVDVIYDSLSAKKKMGKHYWNNRVYSPRNDSYWHIFN